MNGGALVDSSVFPRIAGSADDAVVNDGRPAMFAPTSAATGGGEGEGVGKGDAEDRSQRVRVQPIDTRIRLHFKQTQVSVREHSSRAYISACMYVYV